MSKPLPQTQHMRPGGIQDATSSNKPQRQVERPAAKRLTKADRNRLSRVLKKAESLVPSLLEAKELLCDPESPFTCAALVISLVDSIKMLRNDVEDIDLFIKHSKDDGTVTELFTRGQDHVSIAEYKLRFIRSLESSKRNHVWRLKDILGEDDDEVKFVIRVR